MATGRVGAAQANLDADQISLHSLVSDTSSMQQAEVHAMVEQQRTAARMAEKERKLQEFRAKTATTAQ